MRSLLRWRLRVGGRGGYKARFDVRLGVERLRLRLLVELRLRLVLEALRGDLPRFGDVVLLELLDDDFADDDGARREDEGRGAWGAGGAGATMGLAAESTTFLTKVCMPCMRAISSFCA